MPHPPADSQTDVVASITPTGPDEPEITQEESVPLDGRDHDGEEMMKQVRNPRLQDPPPDAPERQGR